MFVYFAPSLSGVELRTLHRVLRTLGDVKLLHVRPLSAAAPDMPAGGVGEVVEIAPDLYVGFLSQQGTLPNGSWDIRFDEWITTYGNVRDMLNDEVPSERSGRRSSATEHQLG